MPNAIVVYQLRDTVNQIPNGESARLRIGRPMLSLAYFAADNTDPTQAWVSKVTGTGGKQSIGVKKPANATSTAVNIDLVVVSSDGTKFMTPENGGLRYKRADDGEDAGDTVFAGFTKGSTGPVTVNGVTTQSVPCLTISDNCSDSGSGTTEYSLFLAFSGPSGGVLQGLLDPKITNN